MILLPARHKKGISQRRLLSPTMHHKPLLVVLVRGVGRASTSVGSLVAPFRCFPGVSVRRLVESSFFSLSLPSLASILLLVCVFPMAWLLVCVWAHERVSAAWLLVFPTPSHFFAAHSAIPRCLYRGDPSASAPCLLIYQSINQSINQSIKSITGGCARCCGSPPGPGCPRGRATPE